MMPSALKLAAAILALLGILLVSQSLWIKAKAAAAQMLLERAFAQSVVSGRPEKPWPWADTWPIARISVPRLHADVIALANDSGQSLAFGPGHLPASRQPGERGTAVFAAHRDTHFAFLGQLEIGDEVRITRTDGLAFTYVVAGSNIVRWDQSGIDPRAEGRDLALVTCWPLDGMARGPLRLVVRARMRDLPRPQGLLSVSARD
jgi:sortase A